jgi:NAD(P)-dependent dehydrogenase (short-subunit alcohol dehydrogenase family)
VSSVAGVTGTSVVVTGGNQGLGRAIAIAFAEAGADVAITARTAATLESVATEIRALGRRCLAVPCDVADEASVAALAARVGSELGPVATVVANAGIAGPTKPLHEISWAEWRECVGTDLDGVFLTFRAFLPGLLERRNGSLIAISSITGKRPLENRTPYAAAKLGVIGLVRTLAVEVGRHGLRANTVVPGGITGPRIERVIESQVASRGVSAELVRQELTAGAALQRMVDPGEVANACVFLASDAASGITGEDLNVSAGLVMY